jgi:hypothetical protein
MPSDTFAMNLQGTVMIYIKIKIFLIMAQIHINQEGL